MFCTTTTANSASYSRLKELVEASRREVRVPHEGDPVSALLAHFLISHIPRANLTSKPRAFYSIKKIV